MELPTLGKQCSEKFCNKLDFLPITCDACLQVFCDEHFTYATHNCSKAYLKNNQVPVCPLCNIPIPIPRGQQPDLVVGAHIDNDCQSDPAKSRRNKVFTNKCSRKGCKNKEVIPVICNECRYNFCLRHRHPADHNCEGKDGARRKQMSDAALARQNNVGSSSFAKAVQDNMSEDEALARALALSLNESQKQLSQEEMDFIIARQIQAESIPVGGSTRNSRRCNVQ